MRIFLSFLLAFLLSCNLYAQDKIMYNEWLTHYGVGKDIDSISNNTILSKKIKSVEAVYIDPYTKKQYKITKRVYSKTGLAIADSTCEFKSFYSKDKMKLIGNEYYGYSKGSNQSYIYDDSGRLIAETHFRNNYWSNSKDSVVADLGKKLLTYNIKGQLTEELWYNNSPENDSLIMLLNGVGNGTISCETLKIRSAGMRPSWGKGYEYDTKGNKIKEIEFSFSGGKKQKNSEKTFKYDAAGKLTEGKSFNASGKLEFHYIYTYDEKGEIKSYEEIFSKHPNIQMKYFCVYDANGNMVRQNYFSVKSSKMARIVSCKYDNQNRLVEKKDTTLLPDVMPTFIDYRRKAYAYNQTGQLVEYSEYSYFEKKEPDLKIKYKDMLPVERIEKEYNYEKKNSVDEIVKYLYEYY